MRARIVVSTLAILCLFRAGIAAGHSTATTGVAVPIVAFGGYFVPSAVYNDPFIVAGQGSVGSTTEESEEAKEGAPSFGAYGKAFFPDLVEGTKRVFSADVAPVALVAVGATGLAFAFDHSVDDYFQKHRPLGSKEKTGDRIGQGYVPIGLGLALFATGQAIDNRQLADAGAVSLETLAVAGVATEALKYITRRQRPNHVDNKSFPSGHASMTTAFAASVSEMYDWNPWVAVPLYSVAAFVGASRIQAGEHHFSDVMAGMTLGTVIGMGMGRNRKEKNDAVGNVAIVPVLDGTYRGVLMSWRF